MRKILVGIYALTALLASGSVLADEHEAGFYGEGKRSERAAAVDQDKDGRVSFDEFKSARTEKMEEHFKKIDANGDGYIDGGEHSAAKGKWKERVSDRRERRQDRAQSE